MSFVPKGYSKLPTKARWDILQDQINIVGTHATFTDFAKVARLRNNTNWGHVYESDLNHLMASLLPLECGPGLIYSYLSDRCVKNTSTNRKKTEETLNKIQHLPAVFREGRSRSPRSSQSKSTRSRSPSPQNTPQSHRSQPSQRARTRSPSVQIVSPRARTMSPKKQTISSPRPPKRTKQDAGGLSSISSVMLANKFNGRVESISYPALSSVKVDGNRALRVGNSLLSRGLIELPNQIITDCLTDLLPEGMDLELVVNNSLRETGSVLRSFNKEVKSLDVYILDWVTDDDLRNKTPFKDRYARIYAWQKNHKIKFEAGKCFNIRLHTQIQYLIETPEQLNIFYRKAVAKGEEGIIIRDMEAPYVTGRSNGLLKWKRMEDSEGLIVSLHLNHQKLELEAFDLEWNGARFKISSGLNAKLRKQYYLQRNQLVGQYMKFTYQDVSRAGVADYGHAPRHAVLLTIRDRADM